MPRKDRQNYVSLEMIPSEDEGAKATSKEVNDRLEEQIKIPHETKKDTHMYKVGIALLTALVIILLAILAGMVSNGRITNLPFGNYDKSLCTSSQCAKVAGGFIRNMDTSAKPCTNFFRFACGGYVKETKPDGGFMALSIETYLDRRFRKIMNMDPSLTKLREFIRGNKIHRDIYAKLKKSTSWCEKLSTAYGSAAQSYGDDVNSLRMQPNLTSPSYKDRLQNVLEHFGLADGSNSFKYGDYGDFGQNNYGDTADFQKDYVPDSYYAAEFYYDYDVPNGQCLNKNIGKVKYDRTLYTLPALEVLNWFLFLDLDVQYTPQMQLTLLVQHPSYKLIGQMKSLLAQRFTTFMSKVFCLKTDQIQITRTKISQFYDKIQQALSLPRNRNETISIAQLSTSYPALLTWNSVLDRLGLKDVAETEKVIVYPNIMQALNEAFKTVEKETLLYEVLFSAPYLAAGVVNDPASQNQLNGHSSKLQILQKYGRNKMPAVSNLNDDIVQYCLITTMTQFQPALAKWYSIAYEEDYGRTASIANNMVNDINDSFSSRIKSNEMLDIESKKSVQDKLSNLRKVIGYPSVFDDDATLEKLYKNYHPGHFLTWDEWLMKALYILYKNIPDISLVQLLFSLEPYIFVSPNAFYIPDFNFIWIGIPAMFPPWFSADYPTYMNYGSLGMIIGHEITHGFDSSGVFFDKYGKSVPSSFLTQESLQRYLQQQKCFIDYYSKQTFGGIKVNGSRTLAENLADNGGIKTSLDAYKKRMRSDGIPFGVNSTLPGLTNYTDLQLYYLSTAQTFCSSVNQKNLARYMSDVHTVDPIRMNAMFALDENFSAAWQCPSTSPMNPANKCQFWKRDQISKE
ncbi:hypothetical protein MP638_007054 [Amoeboaphelidium occidentale]|nr:hypothetical protein MP638_007054 [Amoeboaphelidium occidentale]